MHCCRSDAFGVTYNQRENTSFPRAEIILGIAALFFSTVAIASIPGGLGVLGKFSFAAKWMQQVTHFLTFEGSLAVTIVGGMSALLVITITGCLVFRLHKRCYQKEEQDWGQDAMRWWDARPRADGSQDRNVWDVQYDQRLGEIRSRLAHSVPEGHYRIWQQEDGLWYLMYTNIREPDSIPSGGTLQLTQEYLADGKPTEESIAQFLEDENIQGYQPHQKQNWGI